MGIEYCDFKCPRRYSKSIFEAQSNMDEQNKNKKTRVGLLVTVTVHDTDNFCLKGTGGKWSWMNKDVRNYKSKIAASKPNIKSY